MRYAVWILVLCGLGYVYKQTDVFGYLYDKISAGDIASIRASELVSAAQHADFSSAVAECRKRKMRIEETLDAIGSTNASSAKYMAIARQYSVCAVMQSACVDSPDTLQCQNAYSAYRKIPNTP